MTFDTSLVVGSFSPFHRGHMHLVQLAAGASNEVIVLSSAKGRGSITEEMKRKYLFEVVVPLLPRNVTLTLCKGSPVREAYEILGNADLRTDSFEQFKSYAVFGSHEDIEKVWPEASLKRYMPSLYRNHLITTVKVERSDTNNVSATEVRSCLLSWELNNFKRLLPEGIDVMKAWKILRGED